MAQPLQQVMVRVPPVQGKDPVERRRARSTVPVLLPGERPVLGGWVCLALALWLARTTGPM